MLPYNRCKRSCVPHARYFKLRRLYDEVIADMFGACVLRTAPYRVVGGVSQLGAGGARLCVGSLAGAQHAAPCGLRAGACGATRCHEVQCDARVRSGAHRIWCGRSTPDWRGRREQRSVQSTAGGAASGAAGGVASSELRGELRFAASGAARRAARRVRVGRPGEARRVGAVSMRFAVYRYRYSRVCCGTGAPRRRDWGLAAMRRGRGRRATSTCCTPDTHSVGSSRLNTDPIYHTYL